MSESMNTRLFFVADPMCSWCWGFRSSWKALLKELPASVIITDLMGGLASDSDEPMDARTRAYIQHAWRSVAERTGAQFNHAFWKTCQPRRSTYPACRGVISAGLQSPGARTQYYDAVQIAYYLEARNPSEMSTLVSLAAEIGLDKDRFERDLQGQAVQEAFEKEQAQVRAFGVRGFPTIIWYRQDKNGQEQKELLSAGYVDKNTLLNRWIKLTEHTPNNGQ